MLPYIFISLAAAFAVLIVVVIYRTVRFRPSPSKRYEGEEVYVNVEKAVSDLAEMVRCKTVSCTDRALEDDAEFIKFKQLLPKSFPNIFEKCEYREIGDRALLFKYAGKSAANPTVLMAHYDVVSAEDSEWEKPAYEGILENGVLWGRGTIDTKITVNAAMQALESLIASNFLPRNDIYLAFSGNEEINGNGAPMIVDLFEREKIVPGVVIDEGGAVVEGVFPGVKSPSAMVGIAEKGMLNVELSYIGNGGHASSPPPTTPIGKLSRACLKIENNPFKFRLSEAAKAMFNSLATHSTFLYRMIFANLWLFAPALNLICKKKGGELNAIVRTTCAFTQMEGSKGMNVIPAKAKMVANLRIIPGETVESAIEHLKSSIDDTDIEIRMINGMNPSEVSVTDSEGFNILKSVIASTWRDVIVSPYLMVACSDSRHWGRISDKVYRFSPMALTSEERASIHGNNEKIPLEAVKKSVEFYVRLILKL